MSKILYTLTDEAPFLATQSLLPIVDAYTATAGIVVETRDISLSGRILSQFPELLADAQKVSDDLAELGQLATTPTPTSSSCRTSPPGAAAEGGHQELQDQGYPLPDYPETPADDQQRDYKARYDKVKGSAVNRCCAKATPTAAHRCR